MNHLLGLNTGIIKSPQGVVVIALKFITSAQSQQLVYLPPDQLQSVLFAVFNCYRTLQQLHQQSPEQVREFVIAQTQALSENIPAFTHEEVNTPDIEYRVTDFIMKQRDGRINFLFFLQNGDVITLELAYTQMEYIMSLFLTTIQNADDAQLTALCLSTNDFLPLYTVDFSGSEGQGIRYNQFSQPEWKTGVFNVFHSIVFIQPDKTIACGAIVKAAAGFEPGRVENIAQYLLQNNTLLSPYKDFRMTIDHVCLDVSSDEGNLDSLLRVHMAHRTAKML